MDSIRDLCLRIQAPEHLETLRNITRSVTLLLIPQRSSIYAAISCVIVVYTCITLLTGSYRKTALHTSLVDAYFFIRTKKFPQRHQYIPGQEDLHSIRGPTFIRKGFSKTLIYTIDTRNIRAAWSTNFQDWGVEEIRLPAVGPYIGKGLITTDGAIWSEARSIATVALSRRFAVNFKLLDIVLERAIEEIVRSDGPLDLQPILFDMYFESSYHFLVGEEIDSTVIKNLGVTSVRDIRLSLERGANIARQRDAIGALKFIGRDPSWEEMLNFGESFSKLVTEKAVLWKDRHPEEHDAPRALSHRFALTWNDRGRIKDEVLNFMVAAPQTVSGVLTHIFQLVSKEPQVWAKAREESLTKDVEGLTAQSLTSMKYLQSVIDESLRLYPSVTLSSRIAKRNTFLPVGPEGNEQPLYVRKGSRLNANIFALHRDPSVFGEDADNFRPERWDEIKRPSIWEFMPFSRGQRACLGKEKALIETKYFLARLAQEFSQVQPCSEVDWIKYFEGKPDVCPVVMTRSDLSK